MVVGMRVEVHKYVFGTHRLFFLPGPWVDGRSGTISEKLDAIRITWMN
jgi:hypothetical protein